MPVEVSCAAPGCEKIVRLKPSQVTGRNACSRPCAHILHGKHDPYATCEHCGQVFKKKIRWEPARFCSQKCANNSRIPEQRKNQVEIVCLVCGRKRRLPASHAGQKTCSLRCRDKAGICPGRPRTRLSYACRHCGKVVILGKGDVPKTFCSKECHRVGRGSLLTPEANQAMREKISRSRTEAWADLESRAIYLAAYARPEVVRQRFAIAREVSDRPEMRRRRSQNAAALARSRPPAKHGWRTYLTTDNQTINMRSTWETLFARQLERLGVSWLYEPRQFTLSDGKAYTPDFFVETPLGACWVELHRMLHPTPGDSKIPKIALARIDIPTMTGQPLIVLDERTIQELRKKPPPMRGDRR